MSISRKVQSRAHHFGLEVAQKPPNRSTHALADVAFNIALIGAENSRRANILREYAEHTQRDPDSLKKAFSLITESVALLEPIEGEKEPRKPVEYYSAQHQRGLIARSVGLYTPGMEKRKKIYGYAISEVNAAYWGFKAYNQWLKHEGRNPRVGELDSVLDLSSLFGITGNPEKAKAYAHIAISLRENGFSDETYASRFERAHTLLFEEPDPDFEKPEVRTVFFGGRLPGLPELHMIEEVGEQILATAA